MNRNLISIILGSIMVVILAFVIILVYDKYLYVQADLRLPSHISSYADMGYFKIDPRTILASLERGDVDVFKPLLEDPRDIEEIPDITISWSQADFLRIASALGQFVWSDPMDLQDWSLYYISFDGSCEESLGFDYAEIVYFKTGTTTYTTRLVEIHPYFGWVGWGSGETYPKPVLRRWKGVDLLGAEVSADDAFRIASKDAKERFQATNYCHVIVSTPQNNDHGKWYVDFFANPQYVVYIVNLDTGKFTYQIR